MENAEPSIGWAWHSAAYGVAALQSDQSIVAQGAAKPDVKGAALVDAQLPLGFTERVRLMPGATS